MVYTTAPKTKWKKAKRCQQSPIEIHITKYTYQLQKQLTLTHESDFEDDVLAAEIILEKDILRSASSSNHPCR